MTLFIIFMIYFYGGFIDFILKEVRQQRVGWANMPKIFHHPQWWIIIWTMILGMFTLGYMYTGDWKIWLGLILFQLEDLWYYIFKYTNYKKFLPAKLNYLDMFNWFKGDYTKRDFLLTVGSAIVIFAGVFTYFSL